MSQLHTVPKYRFSFQRRLVLDLCIFLVTNTVTREHLKNRYITGEVVLLSQHDQITCQFNTSTVEAPVKCNVYISYISEMSL